MVTMTRTDALFAMWMIEKRTLHKDGWEFLRESLDLPIGTPKAQIRSTLETYLYAGDFPEEDSDAKSED
jgi:hypothetical protein